MKIIEDYESFLQPKQGTGSRQLSKGIFHGAFEDPDLSWIGLESRMVVLGLDSMN
jgi:hypothetical protein